jgi:hypothetical protein
MKMPFRKIPKRHFRSTAPGETGGEIRLSGAAADLGGRGNDNYRA